MWLSSSADNFLSSHTSSQTTSSTILPRSSSRGPCTTGTLARGICTNQVIDDQSINLCAFTKVFVIFVEHVCQVRQRSFSRIISFSILGLHPAAFTLSAYSLQARLANRLAFSQRTVRLSGYRVDSPYGSRSSTTSSLLRRPLHRYLPTQLQFTPTLPTGHHLTNSV